LEDNEIIKRNNKGVFIEERDMSLYNVTKYYNQLNLVVGVSKTGVINQPVVVVSPDNFEQIYGKHDYSLERKGSYFHRTVKNMLEVSPVLCLNLRITDRDLDKFNYVNISTASDKLNSKTRSAPMEDFYNITDGFWKRSTEDVLKVANDSISDASKNPITVVNQSDKTVSVLFYKSTTKGFDVTVEDWYGVSNTPAYLHPRDLVSDYMIDVLAVDGKWDNYDELNTHPKWGRFFSKTGIRVECIGDFLAQPEVTLVRKWTGSMIPYFKDRANRDIFIQTVVNDDVNETGIILAFDVDGIEAECRNGLMDVIGDNLSQRPKPELDFLSYKRNLTDAYLIPEKILDQPNNAFGNPDLYTGTRTQLYSEGNVNGVKLKALQINATQRLQIRPFEVIDDECYVIFNGKKIELDSNIEHILNLSETLSGGMQMALLIYVDTNGVHFRRSEKQPIAQDIILPEIDPNTELALAYYRIWQKADTLEYGTEAHGVSIGVKGFINPFGLDGIHSEATPFTWQYRLLFEGTQGYNRRNYALMRRQYMFNWITSNLKEKESIILDTENRKQTIQWVESGTGVSGKYLTVSVLDKNVNIRDITQPSFYIKDLEFIPQNELIWREKIELYTDGKDGIIGEDSLIYDSFISGQINSGDPFFRSLANESSAEFLYTGGVSYLILREPEFDYSALNKILIFGTEHNDGLYTISDCTNFGGEYALVLHEKVSNERGTHVKIFNGENPKIVNLFHIEGKMMAKVADYDGDIDELYRKLFAKEAASQWNKTIEIEHVLTPTKVLVAAKHAKFVKAGYYFLSNEKPITEESGELIRQWTRIVDSVRWSGDETMLLVETDAPIRIKDISGDMQTNMLIPVPMWVDSLDFKVLDGNAVRKEVLPDGTEERQNQILNLIANNAKMSKALQTEKMAWRYLVDSFGLGLTSDSKHQLAQLCENKGVAMGFLNVPSIKYLRQNKNVSFSTNGIFDSQKFLKGGERSNSSDLRFSLTGKGKSHVMYLTPYVVVSEMGRRYEVPPSSYVAQAYMQKHNTTKYNAWDIVAGVNHRIPNIDGLEYIFDTEQLIDLDIMRVTPITAFENNIYYLSSENTAQDSDSLLGYAHYRESLIEIETSLKDVLSAHQWALFTNDNIEQMLGDANLLCEQFKKAGVITDYSNEFDVSNENIDSQLAILNTYVELVAGMGRILLRINIMKTNSI
jgi:hypothetical protein